MSASQNEQSREEKIAILKRLIESEDAFLNNQATFEEYLSDPDPNVRVLAIQGLWDYPDPGLIDSLIGIATSDPDQKVRNQAITGLGRYVYEGEMADYGYDQGPLDTILRQDELPEESYQHVVAFLLNIAQDLSATLDARCFSIEALGFASEPQITNLVEQAYHDPDAAIKTSALFAMGRSGLARWVPYILAELDNPDPRIQLEAVRAAGELFLDEAAPTLVRLAQSGTDQNLRCEAIWALGHTASLEAFELLDAIAHDPTEDEETRELAQAALDEYGLYQEMDEIDSGLTGNEGIAGETGGGNGYFLG
jgi:HEAT repeat protein